MRCAAAAGFTLVVLNVPFSQAAEPSERLLSLHRAARNQLGVLEYCQSLGLAGEGAVMAQRRTIGSLPPVAPSHVGEQEEVDGRLGYLAFDGRQATFLNSARAQGLTLTTACEARVASALAGR